MTTVKLDELLGIQRRLSQNMLSMEHDLRITCHIYLTVSKKYVTAFLTQLAQQPVASNAYA